jgi:hypothetical protein
LQYGYGQGTFLNLHCANISYSTTSRNPSWALYASETNPAKGPMPTIIPSSTKKSNALSAGAIAGIVIGSIIAVGLAVAAITVIWFKLRKTNSAQQVWFKLRKTNSAQQVILQSRVEFKAELPGCTP